RVAVYDLGPWDLAGELPSEIPGPKVIHSNSMRWGELSGRLGAVGKGRFRFSWPYYSEDLRTSESLLKTIVKTLKLGGISSPF
ncbi:MAG: hypothetical protein DRJ56_01035, partial [Thermoprotei archaeon]